jgi:hypothetical protein
VSHTRALFRGFGVLRWPLALLLAFSAIASAQEPRKGAAYAPDQPVLKWEITLGGAGGFSATSVDLENAMRRAGYGSTDSLGTTFPQSSGDFFSSSFFPSVRYRIGGQFAVGASGSSTRLGSTTGHGPGAYVTIARRSEDVALVVFWRPLPGFRVGAGPAWYRLTGSPEGGPGLVVSRIGWLVEGGLAFPEEGRFYADFGVQYRATGSADFGVYQPPSRGPITPAQIALNGIGCGHGAFLAGIGFRF